MLVDEAEKLMCPFGGDCVAYQCMAWRWHHEDTFIGETVGGIKILTNGERIISETDGYCGLAGKAGAE